MRGTSTIWQEKIDRAELLARRFEEAAEVLLFYKHVLRFQESEFASLNDRHENPGDLAPFAEQFFEVLASKGTAQMKQIAEATRDLDWASELKSRWDQRTATAFSPSRFIAEAVLQPYARRLAATFSYGVWLQPSCPVCECMPQLAVMRPEGDGAKRYLFCGFCSTEWEYRRVICANCGELDKEKLPVFTPEELAYIRLAGCDTCHRYLKCIDLTVDGHAKPEVDDLATIALSVWMNEQGFQPIRPSLFGF